MAFDGTDFVVIDDEITNAPTAQTVDVFAEQRLRGNAYYLSSGRNPVTLTLYQGDVDFSTENVDYTMDRPWMSLDYAAGMRVPLYVQRGVEAIKLSLLYRCECPYDKATYNEPQAGGEMYYQVRLTAPNGAVIGTATGTLARTASGTLTQDEAVYNLTQITLSVTPYTGRAGYGTLEFRVKSELGSDSGDNVTLTGGQYSATTAASGDFNYPASPPTSASPELLVVQQPDGDRYEIYSMRPNGSDPETVYIWPPISRDNEWFLGFSCDLYWLTYMQVRSIQVETIYDEQSIAPIDVTALAARTPVRASEFLAHAVHPATVYQRPRHVAIGPGGYRPTRLESWPSGYHTRWPVATNSSGVRFVDDCIHVDIDGSGRVEVVLDVIGTFYSPQFGADGQSGWRIAAALYEYDTADTDWDTAVELGATVIDEVTVKTYRVTPPGGYYYDPSAQKYDYPRFIYSKFLMHDAQSTPEDWQYAHREGLLYPEDYPLIQRVVVSIDVASAYTGTCRLYTLASYVASSLTGFDTEVATADRLHLTCVGYSAYQYRDV